MKKRYVVAALVCVVFIGGVYGQESGWDKLENSFDEVRTWDGTYTKKGFDDLMNQRKHDRHFINDPYYKTKQIPDDKITQGYFLQNLVDNVRYLLIYQNAKAGTIHYFVKFYGDTSVEIQMLALDMKHAIDWPVVVFVHKVSFWDE